MMHVRHDVIQKLANSWPKRTTIRSDKFPWSSGTVYDPTRPDYPERMVPFANHPRFLAVEPERRHRVLTWAWLVYNERTILAEEHIANPAFTMIMHGAFDGADDVHVRQAIQQTLIDEHFHTLIHTQAIDETCRRRGITASRTPDSVTRRRYLEALARATDPWQKALVTLAFAIVAEVSVNAYLELLAADDTIQPLHRLVPHLHNRDEFAHGELLVEVAKILYVRMSERQQRFFVTVLPEALYAYAAQDFSAWRTVLARAGIADGDEIVADCERDASSKLLVRDFSGLHHLADELEITNDLDYRFVS
jgi:hypothetical protein